MFDRKEKCRYRSLIGLLCGLFVFGPVLAEGRLRGKALDDAGNPVEGVTVKLIPADEGIPLSETTSSKKGKFVFGLIRPGTYRLVAFNEGMRISWIDANIAVPDDESLWAVEQEVPPGTELPQFSVTGLSQVTYDLRFSEHAGDPGEFGTGLPVSPVSVIVKLVEERRLEEAQREVERNLQRDPDSATYNYLLAFVCLARERLDAAQQAVERCLAADPSFEGARLLAGRILHGRGDLEGALEQFKVEFGSAESTEVRRDSLLEQAIVLEKLERLEEAAVALEQLIALAPEMVEAYTELANLYLKLGRREDAARIREQIKERGADDPDLLYNLGAERFNAGDFEAAAGYFAQVVEISPEYADAYLRLGFTRLNLGDTEGAAASLRKFVELGSKDDENVATARAILERISPD